MPAKTRVINFEKVRDVAKIDHPRGPGEDITRPRSSEGQSLTGKQIRARARRRIAKDGTSTRRKPPIVLTEEEFNALYKPIEEWDLQELARGRPRNASGNFHGRSPSWVTRQVFEAAQERFKQLIKLELNDQTVTALDTLQWIMRNDDVDEKGKPMVPASAKLDAAKFLIEHTVGKPKQEVQNDISVRLEGILGVVMANPNEALASGVAGGHTPHAIEPAYKVGYFPGFSQENVEDADLVDDGE